MRTRKIKTARIILTPQTVIIRISLYLKIRFGPHFSWRVCATDIYVCSCCACSASVVYQGSDKPVRNSGFSGSRTQGFGWYSRSNVAQLVENFERSDCPSPSRLMKTREKCVKSSLRTDDVWLTTSVTVLAEHTIRTDAF